MNTFALTWPDKVLDEVCLRCRSVFAAVVNTLGRAGGEVLTTNGVLRYPAGIASGTMAGSEPQFLPAG